MIWDFALIMLLALAFTGLVWGLDAAIGAPMRRRKAEDMARSGQPPDVVEAIRKEPVLVEYARAFFPVILVVFLLRSFLVEPFRIPSGSMLPSLLVGDFILVNKFVYGIRLPVLNKKIINIEEPKRGDVMVFRFPGNPADNYIKRVIGLPGDRILYKEKQLFINGQPVGRTDDHDTYAYQEGGELPVAAKEYTEDLDGVRHAILLSANFNQEPMEFTVPAGHYFVMGDNRDHSNDSRYWGYVPEANLVGKAFLIWFSWDAAHGGGIDWARIGKAIH
jgi:signal peptidase I